MTIDFYKSTDDVRTLHKTFTDKTTVTSVSVTGAISILYPTLILAYSASLLSYTHFYSDTFGRWYRIDSMTMTPSGQLHVVGSVDVLATYADQIAACTAQAIRSAAGTTDVPDQSYPIDPAAEYVTSVLFTSGDLDPPAVLPENPRKFILTLK